MERLPAAVSRYVVHDAIASGGMATVHLGRLLGPAGFSRTVAIKRLHPHLAKDPEFIEMLLDEARLAARVRHPNVVGTLDLVESSSEAFLVMEYVHGESLSRLVYASRRGDAPIPVPIACAIMSGVLAGLHAAHETRGERDEPLHIVHRDVSPQNILVGTDGVARLVDFGVAKAALRQTQTLQGQLKGKVAYMAPEQLTLAPVDRRTDVFAAAVVFWELLTGARLFHAPDPSGSVEKICLGTVSGPRTLVPDLPPKLDEVVLRGLKSAPADRFATARDMAEALEQAAPGASPRAVGEWVERVAAEALRTRAACIAKIEQDSPEVHRVGQPTLAMRRLAVAEAPTEISLSLALERPHAPLVAWRGAWMAGAAVALGALGLFAALRVRGSPKAEPLAPAVADTPVEEPSAPAAASSSPAPLPPSPPATTHARTPVRPVPRPARPDCQPSFYVDAQGIKHFKPECVR